MRILTVLDSMKLLLAYKIPFAKSLLAKNVEQAVILANNIGYPVVLKVVAEEIVHKAAANAVATHINNDEELIAAYQKTFTAAKKKFPKARIQGVLVQQMVSGKELIIGGKKDPQFGQIIMFGIGGIFVEFIKDVVFRLVPIERIDAEEMVEEIRMAKLFDKSSKEWLVKILLRVSNFLEENQKVVELDINPLMLSRKGVLAVDARIVLSD
jgi:acyl-CoA synthetase (NDP forming)